MSPQTQEYTINGAGDDAIDDHRPCHSEHPGGHTGDEALTAEVDGRGGHSIGKTGDRHQGPRPTEPGDLVVDVESRQQYRQQDERCGGSGGSVLVAEAQGQPTLPDQLAQYADGPADEKGQGAVLYDGRGLFPLFDQRGVFLFAHVPGNIHRHSSFWGKFFPKEKFYADGRNYFAAFHQRG